MDTLYLDMCSLKRPFDDQSHGRIRREAAAVATILERGEAREIRLVRSFAHRIENDANPREDRRLAAALWLKTFAVEVTLTSQIEERASELHRLGFGPLDALHVACAEAALAICVVTCDDRLIALGRRYGSQRSTWIATPVGVPYSFPHSGLPGAVHE